MSMEIVIMKIDHEKSVTAGNCGTSSQRLNTEFSKPQGRLSQADIQLVHNLHIKLNAD